MNLAAEIKEYLNQDKAIIKIIEDVQQACALAYDIETEEAIIKAEKLEKRMFDLEYKIRAFTKITCEAFKITEAYFINCVNQYSEVS